MARGKKRKGGKRSPLRRMAPREAVALAWLRLAEGKPRDAIDLFRSAQQRDPALQDGPALFACACSERARQLDRIGEERQAAAMRRRAAEANAVIRLAELPEAERRHYARYADLADSLPKYADLLRDGGSDAGVERSLADRLVLEGDWDVLQALDPDRPLRRDASMAQGAIDAMKAADWPRAEDALRSLPRRSPYAGWRLFCRGMKLFSEGDDAGLKRVADLMPTGFILAGTVAEWRRICGLGDAEGGEPVRKALGLGDERTKRLAAQFSTALGGKDMARVRRLLPVLADELYPEDPALARKELLVIAWMAARSEEAGIQPVLELNAQFAPPGRMEGVLARQNLTDFDSGAQHWTYKAAKGIVECLGTEFARAEERDLARARLLDKLARIGQRQDWRSYFDEEFTDEVYKLIDEPLEGRTRTWADLMLASLKADPRNKEGYAFVLEDLRRFPDFRPQLERALGRMAHYFPSEPEPLLEARQAGLPAQRLPGRREAPSGSRHARAT